MATLPQRFSLVSQTCAILREEIGKGTWQTWLPGERALCETFQVSRNTLRAALVQLKSDGTILPKHGAGNRIVRKPKGPASRAKPRDVALLTPVALERLRPSLTLWIDELRAMLSERNCRLHVFSGLQYFRRNPSSALERLIKQQPHACWLLTLSNVNTQRWFERHGVPCVVAGSIYAGLKLPFRDLDHRAMCRHAAGMMLGLGHRKVALLIEKSHRAGDIESEAGFVDGVRKSPHPDAEAVIGHHEATVASIVNALRRLMETAEAPTALLVANPYHYLTVVSRLAQMGWRIPRDVSVISRDDDQFLSFLVPTPAHYGANPRTLAMALMRPVMEIVHGSGASHPVGYIMPKFVRGQTLTKPGTRDRERHRRVPLEDSASGNFSHTASVRF